jgi:hypothetical protein
VLKGSVTAVIGWHLMREFHGGAEVGFMFSFRAIAALRGSSFSIAIAPKIPQSFTNLDGVSSD